MFSILGIELGKLISSIKGNFLFLGGLRKIRKGYFPLICIDNQYIMIFRGFACLFLVLQLFPVSAQEIDSILLVKKSSFLADLAKKKGGFCLNWVDPNTLSNTQSPKLTIRGQQLIKQQNDLLIHFAGSGLLYKWEDPEPTDSIWRFKRIDHTENTNYNFAAFSFVNGNDIYNIGGYGFWKSNGTLRKFNWKDKEWDVAPLNQEIFLPGIADINWFDPKNQYLYTPFQQEINAGLIDPNSKNLVSKNVYRLDLQHYHWERLGQTSNEAMDLLQKTNFHVATDHGLLTVSNDDLYLVDYDSNQISVLHNSSFAQSLLRLGGRYLRYFDKGKLYVFNPNTGTTDTIAVNRQEFKDVGYPIWKSNNTFYLVIAGMLLLLLIPLIYWQRKRKQNSILPNQLLKNQALKIQFSETERSLIKLLLEKSMQDATASIHEINYVLGTKDKNTGMQKKVRSDVINSINEKFSYLSHESSLLIQSIRSETDKRYFEYLIKKEQATAIKALMLLD